MEEAKVLKCETYVCGTILLAKLTTDCELDHILSFSRDLRSQFYIIMSQCVEYNYNFLRPDFFHISEKHDPSREELNEFFEFLDGNGFIPWTYGGFSFNMEKAQAVIEKLKRMQGDTNDS